MSKLLVLIIGLLAIGCASTKTIPQGEMSEINNSKAIVVVIGEKYLEQGQATFGENASTGLTGAFTQDTLMSEVNQNIRKLVLDFKAVELTKRFGLPVIKKNFNSSTEFHSKFVSVDTLAKSSGETKFEYDLGQFKKMGYDYAFVVKPIQYGVYRPVRIIAYRPFGIATAGVSIVNLKTNEVIGSSKPRINDTNKVETGWKKVENYKSLRSKVEDSYSYVMSKAINSLIPETK